jgi:hypothetical protein
LNEHARSRAVQHARPVRRLPQSFSLDVDLAVLSALPIDAIARFDLQERIAARSAI